MAKNRITIAAALAILFLLIGAVQQNINEKERSRIIGEQLLNSPAVALAQTNLGKGCYIEYGTDPLVTPSCATGTQSDNLGVWGYCQVASSGARICSYDAPGGDEPGGGGFPGGDEPGGADSVGIDGVGTCTNFPGQDSLDYHPPVIPGSGSGCPASTTGPATVSNWRSFQVGQAVLCCQ